MTRKTFFLVDDLKIHIEKLLKPSEIHLLNSQCRKILKLVYKHLESFEETAKTTLHTKLYYVICSEVYRLRGIVEKIGSDPFYFEFEEKDDDDGDHDDKGDDDYDDDVDNKEEEEEEDDDDGLKFSVDEVKDLMQGISSFTRRLKKEELRCADGLYNSFPDDEEEEEEEEGDDVALASKMVGARDVYEELKDKLMYTQLYSLVGMPGIGKTTLANKFFHDPTIVDRFDHRVWVRVGKKCRVKDIPLRILAEIDPDGLVTLREGDVEVFEEYLKEILKSKRYLIVLDDVWDRYATHLLHPLLRYELNGVEHPFLNSESESRILLTSRLQQLNEDSTIFNSNCYAVTMRLLNKKESWDLFSSKVFSNGSSCPSQLEKVGKKISKKCEGLPLTIVTVARLLSEEESTPEYWNEVAVKKNHPLFMDAYDEISKVLLSSYTYLPRLLQMCFLYVGLFPQNYEISRSKLINLWVVDRFLELDLNIDTYFDAISCLEELVTNSVVRVYKQSTLNLNYTVKKCGLHSSLWHLSKKKAGETKFALILSSPDDCLGDGMKGHHRLSIQSNVLFAMKDVHKSVEDHCASDARSLLCFGPYHKYQVPLCFRLKLLRELDALSIRFYEFPVEVLQLVQLRYLALTVNGLIPPSVSQLQFLEFFIVDRHQSIKSCKDASYLPIEIWSLQALKHLQVTGHNLPNPRGASLGSLETLLNVSARSCTEAVFKGVPNLNELRIQIELTLDVDGKPLRCFDHISHLYTLHKLKCVIVNPEVVPPIVSFTSFPEGVTILCFSGLGYSWKELSKIASLPMLYGLKLKNYAFQGPEWEVEGTGFADLFSLVIEDIDIVSWKLGFGAFEGLASLIIKSCYKLDKIHGVFGQHLQKIELVDCNPSLVAEMKKTIPETAELIVHSSWEDGKLKI